MTKRSIIDRYHGTALGFIWSIATPLMLMLMYTFVFSVIFQMRWGTGSGESKVIFAQALFTGLLLHTLLADTLSITPNTILANQNLVKKIVFPLEILPVVSVLASFANMLLALLILIVSCYLTGINPGPELLYLPLILLPFLILCLGLAWLLSAFGTYIRDIQVVTTLLSTLLLFSSPVLYPIEVVPEVYRPYMNLNPLTIIISETRAVLLEGGEPNLAGLGYYLLISLGFTTLGFFTFQNLKKGFADVV
jgi:lipopolysaccharide transport system permease protein